MTGKYVRSFLALVLSVATLLSGCGQKSGGENGQNPTGGVSGEAESFDFLDETDLAWVDNSLDDLRAILNLPVKALTKEQGEQYYSGSNLLCEGGYVRMRNHGYDDVKKDWTDVSVITMEGGEYLKKITLDPEKKGYQFRILGTVSGRDAYVACDYDFGSAGCENVRFYELDKDFRFVGTTAIGRSFRELSRVMEDASGNIHLTYYGADGRSAYAVFSPEGKAIFDQKIDGMPSLVAYGGGRIALCVQTKTRNTFDRRFYEANVKNDELRELAVSKDETVRKKFTDPSRLISEAIPVDEYRILWSSVEGLCAYDVREGSVKVLYEWSRHGIANPANAMAVLEDGTVALLYDDAQGTNLLVLKETGEKQEIPTITFAVTKNNLLRYQKAVTCFNKRYPGYGVILRDDWEETSLLTQLGAGTGPVLVDTDLTGFEELEKLWQPLDGFLDQTDFADVMIPAVREFGKIGDVTYGISADYDIHVMLVSDPELTDWDYEGWLDALEKGKGAALTYGFLNSYEDERKAYFKLLRNGLGDSYYVDAESGELIFGTEKFDRVLRLSEKARKCPPHEDGKALLEGRAVCEVQYLFYLGRVINLKRRMEAEGVHVIGFPTGEGSRYLLAAQSPICIRSTASEEEKKIAYTFLKVLLSDDEAAGRSFPIRWDAVDEMFSEYEANLVLLKESGIYDPSDQPELMEGDREFFEELLRNGAAKKAFPIALENIFDEELDAYLSGGIDGKALSERLRNRFWLYLEEQK